MHDPRDIENGWEIPSEGYCDQPFVVKTLDGAWLCTMTTGAGREGDRGQHIVSTRSLDQGRTWEPLTDIEPQEGPEASWVMPLVTPSGRVYVFYTYNAQDLRRVMADDPPYPGGFTQRVDSLGEYAFKYSDDHGRSWSAQRGYIPVREMEIDRRNPYQGKVRFFWGVGKPVCHAGSMYLGFAKIGRFGSGFMAETQACFLCSDNILNEPDPEKIHFETLPEGEYGLRAPQGPVADEANLTVLSDGSLFCTYRTVDGHPCQAYSRDGGRNWSSPAYMEYAPGGMLVNHPRAANFVRRLEQGKYAGRYIYWFHNHNGRSYEGRNPAWLLGGVERDSVEGKVIHWGLPEVVLYASDRETRISYPDFIEDEGRLYITETQKETARVHRVPDWLLERLWQTL